MTAVDERTGRVFHEAGHAVAAFILGLGVERLSLAPGSLEGSCRVRRGYPPGFRIESNAYHHELWPRAISRLAGPRAGFIAAGEGAVRVDVFELATPGTDPYIVYDMLELVDEEHGFELFFKADDEAREVLEANWRAVEQLAGVLVQERDMSRERITEILMDCGLREGRIPVRLESPVRASSPAAELEAWIHELEAFRTVIDHPNDLEVIDWQIELTSVWLARASGRDSVHRSSSPQIARRNGKGVSSSEP